MRAAVIHQHGGPDVLTYVEDFPDPQLDADEVLLDVKACSLNYHDIFTRRGMPGITIPMPMIMGIDLAGTVSAVGSDVTGFAPGDRVLVDPVDREKPSGLIGETRPGGLADLCAVPQRHLVKLPDAVSFEAAAALPVAYGTAYRMMIGQGRVKSGERVLILGASGGVGTCAVLLAKQLGAEVIACASSDEKLEALRGLGADHGINYAETDFMREVWRLFDKPARRSYTGGVDVVVNFTGGDTWVPSLRSLKRGGRLLTCGATAGFDPKTDIRYIWTYELMVQGSNGWTRQDLEQLIALIARNELEPVISSRWSLADAGKGFAELEDRKVFGKIIVTP